MLFAAFTLNAQNFTLQQCIDYALLNETSYRNATLDEEIAKAKVGEIRGIGLPQITGSANLLDNIVVQKAFIPENAFNPLGNPNKVLPLGFGIKYSSSASLALSQIIFDGSYLV
ncbi:hypothetical protein, partial [Corallococcus praedator]|uniref:hypothetical protein n=1 Tax=Corallococcus praedator TaxID=2316724 RepID=UPI001ABF207C